MWWDYLYRGNGEMLHMRALLAFGSQFSYCGFIRTPPTSAVYWSMAAFFNPGRLSLRGKAFHCLLVPVILNPCTFTPGSLTQPPRSDLTLERAWTNPPSSTPDYLAEALRTKRSNLRRSASNGEHVEGDEAVTKEKQKGVSLGLPVLVSSAGSNGVS